MRRAAFSLVLAVLVASAAGGEQGADGAGEDAAPSAPEAEAITTASGLQITHLVEGEGEKPTAANVVEVHYHGTFPDGRVFDSSVDRGKPARFPLRRVIKCWTEGVQMIRVGGKARLVCPPQIAYGVMGTPGGPIPPNATLHFEVELLGIVR